MNDPRSSISEASTVRPRFDEFSGYDMTRPDIAVYYYVVNNTINLYSFEYLATCLINHILLLKELNLVFILV